MLPLPLYTGTIHPDLSCLNETHAGFLRAMSELCINIDERFIGGSTHETERDVMRARLNEHNLATMREAIAWAKTDKTLKEHHRWKIKTAQSLDEQTTWNFFHEQVSAANKLTLRRLEERWKFIRRLAPLNSDALAHIAFELIPALENYLEYANLELNYFRRQIPEAVFISVAAYLNQLQEWMNKTRGAVIDAMTERLLCASHTRNFSHDDVLVHLGEQLKSAGALPSDFRMPGIQYNLTSQKIIAFQNYVKTHSPQAALRLKHRARWLALDNHYTPLEFEGQWCAIPKNLDITVPLTKLGKWWHKMTGADKPVRYWVSKQETIIHARLAIQPIKTILEAKRLEEVVDVITTEIKQLEKQKPEGFLSELFLHAEVMQIKNHEEHWQDELSVACECCIDALTRMIKYWEEISLTDEFIDVSEHQEFIDLLIQICRKVQERNNDVNNIQNKNRLDGLIARIQKIQETKTPAWLQFKPLIDELKQGVLKGQSHLRALDNYLSALQENHAPENLREFLRHSEGVAEGLTPVARDMLDKFTEGALLNETETAKLGRCVYWGSTLDKKNFDPALIETLKTLTQVYWQHLANESHTWDESWLTQCENILMTLYQIMGCADKNLSVEINKTRKRRSLLTEHKQLQQDAKLICQTYLLIFLKEDTVKTRDKLIQALWIKIDAMFPTHTKACHEELENLIAQALRENKSSLTDLALLPYQKTLLGLSHPEQKPLRYLDMLLNAQALNLDEKLDAHVLKEWANEFNYKRAQLNTPVSQMFQLKSPAMQADIGTTETHTLTTMSHS